MALHPIEFRYGTPEMKQIWEEENKLEEIDFTKVNNLEKNY